MNYPNHPHKLSHRAHPELVEGLERFILQQVQDERREKTLNLLI